MAGKCQYSSCASLYKQESFHPIINMRQTAHFDLVAKVLKSCGLRSGDKSWTTYIFKYVLTAAFIVLITLIVYDFYYVDDIGDSMAVFISLSIHSQVFVRHCVYLKNTHLLEEILEDVRHFWDYDLFGKAVGDRCRKNMTFGRFMPKYLCCAAFILVAYYNLMPFFSEHFVLPQACYIPEPVKYTKWMIYLVEVVSITEIELLLILVDGFLFCVCAELENQFILLQEAISSVQIRSEGVDKSLEKLTVCWKHHLRILKTHHKVEELFSEFFLFSYFITIATICIVGYSIKISKSSSQKIIYVDHLIGVLLQISYCFIPVSCVEIQAEKLAFEIYSIDWYNTTDRRITNYVIFSLMKTQRQLRFSGKGLIYVNRTTFIEVLKTGFSIFTLLGKVQ